jgi:hypothetical protein
MNKLLYIFLFINLNCFGQEIKITFCDILSKEAVENVHIISNDVVYISNNEGNVFLSMNQNHSNLLKASHLSYNDSYFFLKEIKDTIFLKSKNIILNEIIINSKKIKTKKVFPKRNINDYFTKNWGNSPPIDKKLSVAFFFPNEDKVNNYLIKKILIATCDYKVFDLKNNESNTVKGTKYSPFKVNLYSVDSTYFIPKDKIFEKDFIVQLKKNQKYAELIIDNNFTLPDGGVFIVISNIDNEELKKRGYFGNPGIVTIGVSKDNKNFPFKKNNAINEGWMLDKFLFDRKNTYYIGVELELYD